MKIELILACASSLLISCGNERNAPKDVPEYPEEIPAAMFEGEPHGLWDGILDYQSEEEIRSVFDKDVVEGVISTWHSMRQVRGME